jgi:hypothetical protein
LQREFLRELLGILGYEWAPQLKLVADDRCVPIVAEVKRANGQPQLWVVEGFNPSHESVLEPVDVLSLELAAAQYQDLLTADDQSVMSGSLEDVLSDSIFGLESPPRWVILVSLDQMVLVDRHKWNASRLLRFDLVEILEERDGDALLAIATLLHREHTCPTEGSALLDTLDENSHRHTYSVSEDLKFALREAIELLGNEALHYRRMVSKKKVFSDEGQLAVGDRETDPTQLKVECLRWVYRLLFVFYIEARPELGYAPLASDVYREGYSLESLRDLEQVELLTEGDSEGYYIDTCIRRLFTLLWEGYPAINEKQGELNDAALTDRAETIHNTFRR